MDKSEDLLRYYGVRRYTRAVMYLSLILSGILTLFIPFESIETEVGRTAAYAWAVSLSLSSIICAWGALTDRWIGEYVGLPLLTMVFFIHALSILITSGAEGNLPLAVYGLLIFAFTCGLSARWRDVQCIKWEADRRAEEEHRGDG
jgi:hypothetical protein